MCSKKADCKVSETSRAKLVKRARAISSNSSGIVVGRSSVLANRAREIAAQRKLERNGRESTSLKGKRLASKEELNSILNRR